jgi:hypothetical protein
LAAIVEFFGHGKQFIQSRPDWGGRRLDGTGHRHQTIVTADLLAVFPVVTAGYQIDFDLFRKLRIAKLGNCGLASMRRLADLNTTAFLVLPA